MGKFFTFADRFVRVRFFEDDPVVLTLTISDDTDKRILDSAALIAAADKKGDVDQRRSGYRTALVRLIGDEKATAILERADEADGFAILSAYRYILDAYAAQKAKNLSAPAR